MSTVAKSVRTAEKIGAPNSIIYTFYSYKGGVGRSMALANIGALMARWGKRVLIVDWDLEAPGIERFFDREGRLIRLRKTKPGMLDLLTSVAEGSGPNWRDAILEAQPFTTSPPVSIITAGMTTSTYGERLQKLRWDYLFEARGLGDYLELLRNEWRASFDFVLIDSRTGISDIGGICTILLPDVIVTLFTTNDQSIAGVGDVVRRAKEAQERLPVDRPRLLAVPILGREEQSEYVLTSQWKTRIASELGEFYKDWLPSGTTPADVLLKLYVPYVAYWSFGERLPVSEKENEIADPRSIGAAYARIAKLLLSGLDWKDLESESEEKLRQSRILEARMAAKRRAWRERKDRLIRGGTILIGITAATLVSWLLLKAGRSLKWNSISFTNETVRMAIILLAGAFGGGFIGWRQRANKRIRRNEPWNVRLSNLVRDFLEPVFVGFAAVQIFAKVLMGVGGLRESVAMSLFIGAASTLLFRNLVPRKKSKYID